MQSTNHKEYLAVERVNFAWDKFSLGFGTYTSLGDAMEKAHAIMKDFDVEHFISEEEIDEQVREYWNEYWSKYI